MTRPRYVSRPIAYFDDDHPMIEGKTVHESEPVNTGLLDRGGRPIFRVKPPVGFVEHETHN